MKSSVATGVNTHIKPASKPDAADLRAWLRLRLSLGIGCESAHALLKSFGLPQKIFTTSLAALRQVVGEKKAQALHQEPEHLEKRWQDLQTWLAQSPKHQALPLNHPNYPQALLTLSDAPIFLYVSGNLALPQQYPGIAVVGSRNPTPQGLANARQFAKHLSARGLCVISGQAIGIDAAAHEGALEQAAGTIAVVGTGLDRVYPKMNRILAHQIAEHGLLLSEFDLGTPPIGSNFPRRNRLIAALSQGCLVVEATLQSGSLITARLANEQGKEVFAIPGSIHAPQSKGCHLLIKQGAKLVENAQDVYDELPRRTHTGHTFTPSNNTTALAEKTTANSASSAKEYPQNTQLLQIMGFDPIAIDSLQTRTDLDMATLQSALLELELQGQLARLPGGVVQRVVQA